MNEVQVSYEGRRFVFEPGRTVRIGRSPDNDVVIGEPTVSRQHAQLTWVTDTWVFQGLGRAGTFLRGATVTRLEIREAVDLALASPQGPVLRIEPPGPGPTRAATRVMAEQAPLVAQAEPPAQPAPAPAAPVPPVPAEPAPAEPAPGPAASGPAAPPPALPLAGPPQAVPQEPGTPGAWPLPAPPGPPAAPAPQAPPAPPWVAAQAAQPPAWGPGAQQAQPAPPWGPGAQGGPGASWGPPGGYGPPVPPPGARQQGPGSRDELASAFQTLVPIKSWLTDPGWRQGLRLLVIPYALLPLVFLALFTSSGNLTTPGWAYSLYVAPLWGIAFWLLIRPPGSSGRRAVLIALGVIIWVMLWMSVVTIHVNSHLSPKGFGDAILVGFNEEVTKALPILLAAMLLLKIRSVKLDVRMWMFLGTLAGLTFGVREASQYTTLAIEHIANAALVHSANAAVIGALSFAYRVFVDGFQHAIWAGVAAFFIGMGVNYQRRRWLLIIFGISIAALLHAINDWYLSNFASPWPWILLQAFSLFLFLGYTMSAASIQRRVRRTPLFRGESMIMDKFTETGDLPKA